MYNMQDLLFYASSRLHFVEFRHEIRVRCCRVKTMNKDPCSRERLHEIVFRTFLKG